MKQASPSANRKRGLPEKVKMRHGTHFVEELSARHDVPVGKLVPLSTLEPDPGQPRGTMGDLTELAASIQDKGVLEPILVRRVPASEVPGRAPKTQYRIISGERRYRAAMEAGLLEVPVIEMDVTEEEALEIALVENLQRKDLTPFEEGEGYRVLGERFGYTHEEISKAVGKSRTVVTESLALLRVPRKVREAAQALAIQTKSLLLELLKEESEEEMIRLLEDVSRRGLSRDDVRRQKRASRNKSGKTGRRKPFVFSFRPSDKSFSLAVRFRHSDVSRKELIETLETVLEELRKQSD